MLGGTCDERIARGRTEHPEPRGKTNIEHGAEPSVDKIDLTEPVGVSNPKQTSSGNMENTGRLTAPEVSDPSFSNIFSDPREKWIINIEQVYRLIDSMIYYSRYLESASSYQCG